MAAQVAVRWCVDGLISSGGPESLETARAKGTTVWVDVLEPDEASLATLQRVFGLHPLAIEDCLHYPQRVKIDLYPEAAFIVWDFVRRGAATGRDQVEVDVFLGESFLITSHRERVAVIEQIVNEEPDVLCRGAEWTLHAILDRGVDDLFPVIDELSERLDDIENELLSSPDDADLQRLYEIKRALVGHYRVVAAERDLLRSMARREQFVSPDAYMYFQDIGDHLARVVDSIDTYRDVASGAMDIYLSAVNNRLNDVMKRLTIVATVFMPLSWITGVFGMNLTAGMWPAPEGVWSFAAVNAVMLAIAVAMVLYFRRKRWL